MESNGGEASKIIDEIEALKAQKRQLEDRISTLESQLRETSTAEQCPADSCDGACPSVSTVASAVSHHGLPSDAIYRYSRHLLLPSFGVQG